MNVLQGRPRPVHARTSPRNASPGTEVPCSATGNGSVVVVVVDVEETRCRRGAGGTVGRRDGRCCAARRCHRQDGQDGREHRWRQEPPSQQPGPACGIVATAPGCLAPRPAGSPGQRERGRTVGCLEGKVAIVTGAGGGIGRAEALALASDGAAVVVNDVGGDLAGRERFSSGASDVVALIEAGGGSAIANADDVSSYAGAERILAAALAAYGRLDILVNNAGILQTGCRSTWRRRTSTTSSRVHLKGHSRWHGQQARIGGAAESRRESVAGRIVGHDERGGSVRQRRPGELRGSQGSDRDADRGRSRGSSSASASP